MTAPKLDRVALISLDAALAVHVVAQYNPAQLQLEESASWSASANGKSNEPHLEYAAGSARTLSLELFFDTYEFRPEPHYTRQVPRSVCVKTKYVDRLGQLLRVIDPEGPEEHRRPPLVELRWSSGMARFRGVIQSLSTKLTMFLADGTPVRATCALKLMEAGRESFGPRRAAAAAAAR